ncbi:MAG: HNH endonuclease [Salinibacterium sp.]|nr:HNH endonuclease [Salinibacterium sp.]
MNRQRDHFTQEDPIGLAGGINLYGFAGGDPVNFSDPFGTCPVVLAALGPVGVAAAAGWCIGEVAVLGFAAWQATRSLSGVLQRDGDPEGESGGDRAGKDFKPKDKKEIRGPEGRSCTYCGRTTTREPGKTQSQADHIEPKAKGGSGTKKNGTNACAQCNNEKSGRPPSQWEPRWYDPRD